MPARPAAGPGVILFRFVGFEAHRVASVNGLGVSGTWRRQQFSPERCRASTGTTPPHLFSSRDNFESDALKSNSGKIAEYASWLRRCNLKTGKQEC